MLAKSKLGSIKDRLLIMPTWKIILMSFAMVMIINFFQQIAFQLWGTIKVEQLRYILTPEGAQEQYRMYPASGSFLGAVIYAPIVETLIYQTLIMSVFFKLNSKFEDKIGLPVIVSALIFGFVHWGVADTVVDNVIKSIGTSLIGIVLACNYAIFYISNRNYIGKRNATINTAIIHGLVNLFSGIPSRLFILIYDFLNI